MRIRTWALAASALGLIAWADPSTTRPEVGKEAAAQEAQRQVVYVFKARARERQRADDIAWRLEVANQDLCADKRPRLGWDYANALDLPVKERAAATEALNLGDGVTIIEVAAGGPAALGAVKPGDVLVSAAGVASPAGKGAVEKFALQLVKTLGSSTAPIPVVVRRGADTLTLTVAPVMACSYGVVVEDGNDVNAYADGSMIHILRPMLKLAESEEELALVIAHELAHNGQHHIQAQSHNSMLGGFGGAVFDIAAAAYGVNTKGEFTKLGMRVGGAHAASAFEAEADYVGLYYMARAGYRTEGAEDFWRKMAVESPDSIFIKTDHPTTPARFIAIAETSKEIEAKRAAGQPLTPNAKAAD